MLGVIGRRTRPSIPECRCSGAVKPKMDEMDTFVKQHCVSPARTAPTKQSSRVVYGQCRQLA